MKNTKEKITEVALRLFAREGYEAVSVSRIAGELGITKGALYRHYRDKRDIFESILRRMERQDGEAARENALPEEQREENAPAYDCVQVKDILAFSREMFRYWAEDDFAADFRRMLTVEQYRSREMAALYQQYLGSGPLQYVTDLLEALGFTKPTLRALELNGALFHLLSVYDGAEDRDAVCRLWEDKINELEQAWTQEDAKHELSQK